MSLFPVWSAFGLFSLTPISLPSGHLPLPLPLPLPQNGLLHSRKSVPCTCPSPCTCHLSSVSIAPVPLHLRLPRTWCASWTCPSCSCPSSSESRVHHLMSLISCVSLPPRKSSSHVSLTSNVSALRVTRLPRIWCPSCVPYVFPCHSCPSPCGRNPDLPIPSSYVPRRTRPPYAPLLCLPPSMPSAGLSCPCPYVFLVPRTWNLGMPRGPSSHPLIRVPRMLPLICLPRMYPSYRALVSLVPLNSVLSCVPVLVPRLPGVPRVSLPLVRLLARVPRVLHLVDVPLTCPSCSCPLVSLVVRALLFVFVCCVCVD